MSPSVETYTIDRQQCCEHRLRARLATNVFSFRTRFKPKLPTAVSRPQGEFSLLAVEKE
jgi:hypothetical protein